MKILTACLTLLLLPGAAFAFDILLDIDNDGDPRTINVISEADTARVNVILMPTIEDELVLEINFGLGGTCWDCWDWGIPFTYGTDTELYQGDLGEWHDENPLIATSWKDISLCYGCCNMNAQGRGHHFIFTAMAAGEGFILSEPMVIVTFDAWVSKSSDFDRCPHTTSDLVSFPRDYTGMGGSGNRLQIGTDFVPTERVTWSTVKTLY